MGVNDPVIDVMVDPVLLATVMVTVRLAPGYRHDDTGADVVILAMNRLMASTVDTAVAEVTVPPR